MMLLSIHITPKNQKLNKATMEENIEQMLEDDDGGYGGASASAIQYLMAQLAQQQSGGASGDVDMPGECANQ